ncbi:MAG: DNA repair protein RecN [Acetobacteraceae bacterium]|nr:DNA repair protein RecN [Acetobacteraceae bacterium]
MLTALSIRDVVLIERLELSFGAGLTVLTGETGAGKSILLDSLGLALGARADTALVRAGAEQASVAACFDHAPQAALALLAEQGLEAEEGLLLRRVVGRDGRSRAYVGDQPVGVGTLRRLGTLLVEVQGQHEQMGLADPATHAALLDAFGVPVRLRHETAAAWRAWHDILSALTEARAVAATAARDEDWLRHAVDELARLAPLPDEENQLAAERQALQAGERRAEAIAAALAELTPRDRRAPGPAAALRAAARALHRLASPRAGEPDNLAAPAIAALERAEEALAEAEVALSRLAAEAEADPRRLEQTEERLFALRAAARKHAVAPAELPGLLDELAARLAGLESGAVEVERLAAAATAARGAFTEAAKRLTKARREAAERLTRAVARELPPLRLDKARFVAEVAPVEETGWGPGGADSVRFLVATNPGQEPGPLARVASGGELSRLMLALKVVLASGSAVPTLVFDEVDSGVGGATAAAVGERLARVAEQVQVLVVTHSPQVAARGAAHMRVAKAVARGRASTGVEPLDTRARREEIARMLAGETITEAARAAADDLLATA